MTTQPSDANYWRSLLGSKYPWPLRIFWRWRFQIHDAMHCYLEPDKPDPLPPLVIWIWDAKR